MMIKNSWHRVCSHDDLVAGGGVCVLVENQQVAIFYLPEEMPEIYAIDNFDPIGGVALLSRGIVGDIQGELVVASPLYKEHYSLVSGQCLEKSARVRVWPVRIRGGDVELQAPVSNVVR